MTRVLIGKDLVLEGPRLKIEDKQLPVNMFAKKTTKRERESESILKSQVYLPKNWIAKKKCNLVFKITLFLKWTKDKKDTTPSGPCGVGPILR